MLGFYTAHVRARPMPVFEALVDRLDPGPGAHSQFLADPAASLIVAQGGWWYRAEYRVVPDEHGCHIEHTLLNVAKTAHRLGRFVGRKEVEAAPRVFEELVKDLRLSVE